jgi:hypothetical protein
MRERHRLRFFRIVIALFDDRMIRAFIHRVTRLGDILVFRCHIHFP